MNLSDNESEYNYDYINSTCDQDARIQFQDRARLVLCYVLFCLGLLGNSTVIWVLLRYIKLKSMTDVYLLCLSLSDLILALSLPLWAHNSHNTASCKLMTGIYQLGFYSGTLFVTLMSVDRYLAIVHAVTAMRARTLRYGIIASLTIWIISVTMAVPQVVFASLDNDDGWCQPIYPDDSWFFWNMQRNFSENTLGLFVCLPIIVFCYVKILLVVSKTRNSKKDKAVKLILIIVCLFVLCWVPYNITIFLQTLQVLNVLNNCEAFKAINSTMSFAEIIALSHCCVNPVIYAFVGEKFRKSLSRVLTRCLGMGHQRGGTTILKDTTDKETSNTPVRSEY
ncbi:C-C chemokine receptor type 8 [Notolabrus celidotus]|uniref:C-C chemokine receptor type 8 n=1 Tax=Notolabrus celidotus TaxID=1203425 RepID=UPI00148FDA8C|nr:C-C chemokine receptor type 8 [Notolabrus celidotus]XP_034553983.1 C-C chemokine receptor type 8 [Notolabrus celidotus]XP_034553984.1 C-C chemokine receptor type 8 [Notolabrus celidotus]